MLLDSSQLFLTSPDPHICDWALVKNIQQERQANDMVEMSVAEKDIEVIRRQDLRQSIDARPRIKYQPSFRNGITGGLAAIVGMITGCAQAVETHGCRLEDQMTRLVPIRIEMATPAD